MKLTKKLILGALNLALLAAVAWYAYQALEDYLANPWTRDGQVRGQVIQVAPRVSGMVTRIAVIDNQYVRAGDLLFELDPEPFEIAVSQAEANLKRARISSRASAIEYERLQEIARQDAGAVSAKDLNRREASYLQSLSVIDVTSEQLRSARLNLGYTRVRASVDGYVSNINFQIGDRNPNTNNSMHLPLRRLPAGILAGGEAGRFLEDGVEGRLRVEARVVGETEQGELPVFRLLQ